MIAEADDRDALSRGLQGLKVRIAKALNTLLHRAGTVFEDRFHARDLKTPRETRNAIGYVLFNARHHAADDAIGTHTRLDPCSSAAFFDGFEGIDAAPIDEDSTITRARSWMMNVGWRKSGSLRVDHVPGAHRPRRK